MGINNLTTNDYLKLSTLAYMNYTPNYTLVYPPYIPVGYSFLIHSSTFYGNNSSQGYAGLAVYNPADSHVIIASSGTSVDYTLAGDLSNLPGIAIDLMSDYALLNDTLPPQYPFAIEFVNAVLANISVVNITTTGHSLGAALSELLVADFLSRNIAINAITFDGPGTKPLIEKAWGSQVANITYNQTVIHAAIPNIVNTVNPQVGQVLQLEYTGINKGYNQFYEVYNGKLISGSGIAEIIFGSSLSSELPFLKAYIVSMCYTPHQLVTFISEMNNATGEFNKEAPAPTWNEDNARSELMAGIASSKELMQLFSVANEGELTDIANFVEEVSKVGVAEAGAIVSALNAVADMIEEEVYYIWELVVNSTGYNTQNDEL